MLVHQLKLERYYIDHYQDRERLQDEYQQPQVW